jgi:PBP1b-binding outer membrane lipoprotein LpoB
MTKKIFAVVFVLGLGLVLAGCLPKKDETKTEESYEGLTQQEVSEELSSDDSLQTIEKELDDTELKDFEQELDSLDKEINQL